MKIKNAQIFLCVALAASWTSYAQQAAPPPVLWLGFNGNYTDSSSISTASPPHDVYSVLNPTFTNDVPNSTCSTSNLFLPGDGSYVEADNVSDLNFNTGNPFSVSSWIKTTSGGLIWTKSTAAADEEGDEQTVECFIGTGDTVDNGDGEPVGSVAVDVFYVGDIVSVATNLNDGNWHHVVVTYTANGTWSIYIDGAFNTSANFGACNEGDNDEGPWSFTVGATLNAYFPLETGTYDPYDGEIDEVGVWNLTLTSGQVASVYTNGIPLQSIEITQQPMSTNLPAGDAASFSVAGTPVNISGTLSYQWESNGVAIDGATSATYTTPPLTESTIYNCLLTVSSVSVSTETAIVGVLQPTPPPGNVSVFVDDFANGSTINADPPLPPTATSTSYEEIASKTWSPSSPTIGPGSLLYGVASSTSSDGEVQALFTTNPITLQNPGNYIQLVVTFADTNILISNNQLNMGLFDSGQVAPWGGGLNNDIKGDSDVDATIGGAQNWQGYIAQFAYPTNMGGTRNSDFCARPAQNNGNNNNQDTEVPSNESGNFGFTDPVILGTSTTPNVALTPGGIYTEVLTYTLLADGSLELQADIYATNTSGMLITSELVNSGAPALTTTFDAFSVGWYTKDNSNPTVIDLQSVQVTATGTNAAPASIPLQLESVGTSLTFTWSNPAFSLSFSTNVAGPYAVILGATSPFTTNTSGSAGFFRLVWP